jgi:hypothetical protein
MKAILIILAISTVIFIYGVIARWILNFRKYMGSDRDDLVEVLGYGWIIIIPLCLFVIFVWLLSSPKSCITYLSNMYRDIKKGITDRKEQSGKKKKK